MSEINDEFVNLTKVQASNQVIKITEIDSELLKEIQTLLKTKQLYTGDVDGKIETLSIKAFADFKESVYFRISRIVRFNPLWRHY